MSFTFVLLHCHLSLLLIASGGTIAGISLGSWLGALKAKVCPSFLQFEVYYSLLSRYIAHLIFYSVYRFMLSLFAMILITSMTLSKAFWMDFKLVLTLVILLTSTM